MKHGITQKLTLFAVTLAFVAMSAHGALADCGAEHAKQKDIVDTAVASGDFQTLVAAAQAAGLVETLQGEGPFTVFAPTDEAFAKLPEGTVEDLLKEENRETLIAILTYHVVAGRITAAQVVELDKATTVEGSDITIQVKDGAVMVDQATVVMADVDASNGVIHVIDSVMIPSE
jgi:uncharacterized surface protein with fasciclin (FAS1) repeats